MSEFEILRDSFGRPLVVPLGGGPRVPYRRTTTFVGALDDEGGLHRWELRQLAVRLAHRPDLVLAVAAIDSEQALASGRGRRANPAREALDEIIEKAAEPASAGATVGTALHALTERLDRGQQLGNVPAPYAADVQAYTKTTKQITWTAIETFRVLDEWRVAGTADRIGLYRGQSTVADIKTGSIDYPGKFGMQLAVYAHSLPYDIATDTRGAAGTELDLRRGLIIHLPAGQGRCDLYEVDIEKGWQAAKLAYWVWQWRSVKGLLTPVAAGFTDLARTAPDIDTLRQLWREAKRVNKLTQGFLDAVGKRREELAANTTKEDKE
jgi:hypothetical protein